MVAIFHGTEQEGMALFRAVEANCVLRDNPPGVCTPERLCCAHRILTDQATLDRLLFARRHWGGDKQGLREETR